MASLVTLLTPDAPNDTKATSLTTPAIDAKSDDDKRGTKRSRVETTPIIFTGCHYADDAGDLVPDYMLKRPGCDVCIAVGGVDLYYSRFLLSRSTTPKVWQIALSDEAGENKDPIRKLELVDVHPEYVCVILGWIETGVGHQIVAWLDRLINALKLADAKITPWLMGLANECLRADCNSLRNAILGMILAKKQFNKCDAEMYKFLTHHHTSTFDMAVKAARVPDVSDPHFADLRFFYYLSIMGDSKLSGYPSTRVDDLCKYLDCISKNLFWVSYVWTATVLKRGYVDVATLTTARTNKPPHVVRHLDLIIEAFKQVNTT